jgi:hypothetical protein
MRLRSFNFSSMPGRLVLAVAALGLCSCVVQRQAVFNESAAKWSAGSGSGSVVGRVYVVMQNDSERVARNTTIDIAPATDYFKEVIDVAFARNRKLTPGDPRAKRYVRTVPTNDEGEFEYHHLPAGDWFVGTDVEWRHSFLDADSNEIWLKEIVPIYARVSVKDGQTVKVTDWTYGRQTSQ